MGKWTKEEIEIHIKSNLGEDNYGAAVIIGALFYKLYGEYPKIGLSGFQAGAIDSLKDVLPDDLDEDPTPCCYQHGVGALSTSEPCPEIADND